MLKYGFLQFAKSIGLLIVFSFTFLYCSPVKDENALSPEGEKYLLEGKQALSEQQIEKAIELFSKVTETDPKHIAGYMNRGLTLLIHTQFARDAVEDFNQVIALDSANADAYNNRGLAYSYLGALNSSMDDFEKALQLDPKFTQAYINRGSCFIHWKKYDLAIKDFTEALKYAPDNPEIYYQRGLAHYKMKSLEAAINDYTKAIAMGLNQEIIYQNRGNAFFKSGKFKESIDDYLKVIQLNPNNINARNNLAVAYDTTGQAQKATAERKILADMNIKDKQNTINKLTPFEKITFKKFSLPGDLISVELPDNWIMKVNKSENSIEMYITQDKTDDKNDYSVGAKFILQTNMEKKYNVARADSLLEFWIASAMKNAEDYYEYNIFQKKSLKKGMYSGFLQKAMIQLAEDQKPLRLYEYILAKYNVIFYAYMQCPEEMYDYYSKIFDKAVETLYVKDVNKID